MCSHCTAAVVPGASLHLRIVFAVDQVGASYAMGRPGSLRGLFAHVLAGSFSSVRQRGVGWTYAHQHFQQVCQHP